MPFIRPTSRRRSRYILPALAFLGLLLWMKATENFILDGGSGSKMNASNYPRTEHRSNKEWAANFAGGSKTVALLPDGDGEEAAKARHHLQSLLHRRRKTRRLKTATKLFLKRRDAFAMLLRSDNEVRRKWNARLSSVSASRGIVVTAGGETPLANAFSVLYTLRKTIKCTLPVTIAHWGASELDPNAVAAFKKYLPDMSFLDLVESVDSVDSSSSNQKNENTLSHHVSIQTALELATDPKSLGYIAKVAAMYAAPYREILLLDADSLPLQDPSLLFETEAYKKHGCIAWPDFWEARPEIWDILGFNKAQKLDPWSKSEAEAKLAAGGGTDEKKKAVAEAESPRSPSFSLPFRQMESGQIIIDRVRHWKVIEWLLFLNTHAQVVYELNKSSIGDKDLLAPAFILAGNDEDFWQVPFAPGLPAIENAFDSSNAGKKDDDSTTKIITPGSKRKSSEPPFLFGGMLQMHPENGSPFFHHRTGDSKLPGRGSIDPGHGILTHVSPPASFRQAGKMTAYRGWIPGWLFKLYRKDWGLWSNEVQIVECIGGKTTAVSEREGVGSEGSSSYVENLSQQKTRAPVLVCSECDSNLMDLNNLDRVCYSGVGMARDMVEKERIPLPISMVKVEKTSVVGVATVAAVEAHALFQEAVS